MIDDLSFQQEAVVWGQAYEIFVKRGVLGCLADQRLIDVGSPALKLWRETKTSTVYSTVVREIGIVDETVKEHVLAALQNMSSVAYGLGHTAMREYLKKLRQPLGRRSSSIGLLHILLWR